MIHLTEYVCPQCLHLYVSKSLLTTSVDNSELGNMVSGI